MLDRGVVIRHMVLPGAKDDSIRLLHWIKENLPEHQYLISIMSQYTPFYRSADYPEINRRITSYEYNKVVDTAIDPRSHRGLHAGKKQRQRRIYAAVWLWGDLRAGRSSDRQDWWWQRQHRQLPGYKHHKRWVPNQFFCFDTHLNVLRYPMDLTSFSLDFVSIWSFSCSLRRLFPKVYIFCSHIDHCISLFDTFSSYLEGFQIIFFRSITRFCVFPLVPGFFRFEKWNETYVFGGLYLLYLESFKYEPFRLLCFVLSFFLMSLLYAISPILSTCF